MKKLIILLFLISIFKIVEAQNNTCVSAQFVCFDSTNVNTFPAGVNAGPGQTGPDYGCLGSEPNPAWVYLLVSDTGNIEIHMQGSTNHDVDFACWGPFQSLISPSPCTDSLTAGILTPNHHSPGPSVNYPSLNMIDCSYDAGYEEWCYIPNAIAGKYYLLMITNYSNLPQDVIFSQSNFNIPGSGRVNCDQNFTVNINSNSPVCSGDTLKLFAPAYSNAQYNWTGPDNFTSNLQNPVIQNPTIANAGNYHLILIDSLQHYYYSNSIIQINTKPTPLFQYSVLNQNVVFTNLSVNSDSSFWYFGDGNSSTLFEPLYSYDTLGIYNVNLFTYNNCGYDSITEQIAITGFLGVEEFEKQSVVISPNPGSGIFNVKIPESCTVFAYEVLTYDGKIIISNQVNKLLNKKTFAIDLTKEPDNIYFLKIYTSNRPIIYKLFKI